MLVLHGESLTPNSLTPSRRLQPEGVGVMIPPHPTYFPQKPRDLVNGAAYEKCLKIESALDVLNTPPVVRHIKELPYSGLHLMYFVRRPTSASWSGKRPVRKLVSSARSCHIQRRAAGRRSKPTDSSRARQHQLAKSVSAEDNQSGPGPSASTTSGFTRPCCASLQQRMYHS